ncbi:MAG: hypothetical protein K9M19_01910 [Candidatus Marinimicrobia bacterium]|nr:hypothetical protein [Candidatus Neomarinimicrobiota bacterium]
MMLTSEHIAKSFWQAQEDRLDIKIDRGRYIVTSPFPFADGILPQIYLSDEREYIKISDEGEMFNRFTIIRGKKPDKAALDKFTSLAVRYGFGVSGGSLNRVTEIKNLGTEILFFLNSMNLIEESIDPPRSSLAARIRKVILHLLQEIFEVPTEEEPKEYFYEWDKEQAYPSHFHQTLEATQKALDFRIATNQQSLDTSTTIFSQFRYKKTGSMRILITYDPDELLNNKKSYIRAQDVVDKTISHESLKENLPEYLERVR